MKLFAATNSDGYKLGHKDMYADGTTKVYSNLTPRNDKIYRRQCTKFYDGNLVAVGMEGAIQEVYEMWQESFFSQPKEKVVARFKRRVDGYLGPDAVSTKSMQDLHDLGFLPLQVKALPEGSLVPMGVPVLTITNTLPDQFWLVNYLETVISNLTWKMSTNATIAREYGAIGKHYGELTGTDEFTRSIQFHDFSCRGMSGPEDAARAGFGHLTQFIGTDTLSAMDYAEDYYGCEGLLAISVPATEHAVATSNILGIRQSFAGKSEGNHISLLLAEKAFMKDLITRKFPTGIVSYVADSFDFWAVLTDVLPELKDTIMAREASAVAPGKLVVRPDSGDPVKVICGDNDAPIGSPEYEGAIQCLWETFGGTMTDKGYKLLDSHIGLIYGDSITTKRAEEILSRLAEKGFASGNVVFGVGSYTYQCNTRDTFGFAVKATYTEVDGQGIAIFKDPKTDSGKKSAKGLLCVIEEKGKLTLLDQCDEVEEEVGHLEPIYKDGNFKRRTSLDVIRSRCKV